MREKSREEVGAEPGELLGRQPARVAATARAVPSRSLPTGYPSPSASGSVTEPLWLPDGTCDSDCGVKAWPQVDTGSGRMIAMSRPCGGVTWADLLERHGGAYD